MVSPEFYTYSTHPFTEQDDAEVLSSRDSPRASRHERPDAGIGPNHHHPTEGDYDRPKGGHNYGRQGQASARDEEGHRQDSLRKASASYAWRLWLPGRPPRAPSSQAR